MRQYDLSGVKRTDTGKKAAKLMRAAGLVPCVLIGNGESTTFSVKTTDLRNLLYTSQIYVVNLDIEGTKKTAIIKELQFSPVNEEILHIDFLAVEADKPITVKIPVKLEGHADGVKQGGKLIKQLRELTVKGLYSNVPERLVVDVTNIGLGKTMKVKECAFEGLEILTAKEAIVAAVRATRASKSSDSK